MANIYTLLIEKDGANKFRHTHNGLPLTKFSISDFECSIDGNKFKVCEKDGASRYVYLVENITIKDNTDAGVSETFVNPITFEDRLRVLQYTPFISHTGIPEAPMDGQEYVRKDGEWVVASGGSGYTPVNLRVLYDGTPIIVPSGFVLTRIVSLNDFNTEFAGVVTDTELVITDGRTDDVYLIDGYTP